MFGKSILIAVAVCLAQSASAAVVGGIVMAGSGKFTKIDDPAGIEIGQDDLLGTNPYADEPDLFAFDEDQNIILPEDITVGGVFFKAGTVVASHYVFFNPLEKQRQMGQVFFDSEVLAVVSQRSEMNATDFLLNDEVTYLTPKRRGLEAADSVTISATNPNAIKIDWTAGTPGDYVRIFTAVSPSGEPPRLPPEVPLPAGGVLLLGGLGTLSLARRKRG